jgi:uncharacterized protein YjgD (DUF1641 family)
MNNIDYNQLHDYFSDQLSETDRAAFEQAVASDEALQTEVAFYQELLQGIEQVGDQVLENQIGEAHQQASNTGFTLTDQDIFDYLNDELEEKKVTLIENRMTTDEAFMQQVSLYTDIVESVSIAGDEELKNTIQGTHQKMKTDGILDAKKEAKVVSLGGKSGRSRRRLFDTRVLAIAASFLLLLSVGLYLFLPSNSSTNQLYANYFEVNDTQIENELDALSTVGFGISDQDRRESLATALELMQTENIEPANIALSDHLETYPTDVAALFYRGLTWMQLDRFEPSITDFEAVSAAEEEAYQSAATWYQALSYLKLNDTASALPLLQSLTTDATYTDRAEALLNEL